MRLSFRVYPHITTTKYSYTTHIYYDDSLVVTMSTCMLVCESIYYSVIILNLYRLSSIWINSKLIYLNFFPRLYIVISSPSTYTNSAIFKDLLLIIT